MAEEKFLMAQALADAVGATKRQIQIWTDAGAIQCIAGTNRQGRGKQRLYDPSETYVAAIVAAAARLGLSIGTLMTLSKMVSSVSKHKEIFKKALQGETESFIELSFLRQGPEAGIRWLIEKDVSAVPFEKMQAAIILNVGEIARQIKH